MGVWLTLRKSLNKLLCPKFEILLETQGKIHWFCRIFARLLNISSVFYTIFPKALRLVRWVYNWHSVKVWRSFYVPNLRYDLENRNRNLKIFLPDFFCQITLYLLSFLYDFPQTLQIVRWVYVWHSVKVWRSFYVPTFRYDLKHKEIYIDFVVFFCQIT